MIAVVKWGSHDNISCNIPALNVFLSFSQNQNTCKILDVVIWLIISHADGSELFIHPIQLFESMEVHVDQTIRGWSIMDLSIFFKDARFYSNGPKFGPNGLPGWIPNGLPGWIIIYVDPTVFWVLYYVAGAWKRGPSLTWFNGSIGKETTHVFIALPALEWLFEDDLMIGDGWFLWKKRQEARTLGVILIHFPI